MNDERKTKSELLEEIAELRQRLAAKDHAGTSRTMETPTGGLQPLNRDEVENALFEKGELLNKILSSTHLCIAYLDTDFRFIYVNRAYAEAAGRSPMFFTGKDHFFLYPNDDKKALFRRAVQEGKPYTAYASPFWQPDQAGRERRYWDWTLYPIKDASGEVEALLLCLLEVTDRIQAEQALRRSENALRRLSNQLLNAQEEERRRIAKELHDGIGSNLTAIRLGLERLADMQKEGGTDDDLLKNLVTMAEGTIKDAKSMQRALRPSVLDQLGIAAALNTLCREFERMDSEIEITKEIDVAEDDVPETLKIVCYRVSQEALNNISKHSNATRAHLSLVRNHEGIALVIRDNGQGFDARAALHESRDAGGMGLSSMKERIEYSGGSLNISSLPGEGTEIRATWPL